MPRAAGAGAYGAGVTSLTRRALTLVPTLVLAAGATFVATPAPAEGAPHPRDLGPTTFSEAGPYAVGERTMRLPSGAKVEVWYPTTRWAVKGKEIATYDVVSWLPASLKSLVPKGESVTYPSGGVRGVPVRHGRYPLVVFSHGYAGFRDQSSFLTSAIASWGFVVAAPDHAGRDLTKVLSFSGTDSSRDVPDLRATIRLVDQKNQEKKPQKPKHSSKGWLRHHVDLTRIGAVGHSAGGRAVEDLAALDQRVDTFIGMAGASAGALEEGAVVPDQPGLILAGSADGIVSLDKLESAYGAMASPKRFVVIGDAGHLAFSDLCEVGASDGGLLAIGELLGIPIPEQLYPLATDGCLEPDLEPTLAWPAIRQVVIAQLRRQLRVDRSDAALTGLTDAFPGIVTDSRSE